MRMRIDEVAEITQKLNLAAPKMYLFALKHYPDIVDKVCDGLGSHGSLMQRLFVPNTILGINIDPISHIHDWEYVFPMYYHWILNGREARAEADTRFVSNCQILFKGTRLEGCRNFISRNIYYRLICKHGVRAFWNNKIAPRNWDKQLPAECKDLEINLHPVENCYIVGDVGKYDEYREFYNFLVKRMKAMQ